MVRPILTTNGEVLAYIGLDLEPQADLTGADLVDADLTGADLSGANLTNADLSFADLSFADLTDADLTGANLSGVQSGSITGNPNLTGTGFLLTAGYLVGPEANLSDANLTGADLTGADLSSADLTGADLSDADLSFADLSFADLTDADLTGADLTDAYLAGVKSGSITGNPNLTGTGFLLTAGYLVGPEANLGYANLGGADLTGADLTNANLNRATYLGSTTGSAFYNAETDFTDAYSGTHRRGTLFDPVAAGWNFVCEPEPDADEDEVCDSVDNCPAAANPGQEDADSNGTGDACNDGEDADSDEWADLLDNCPSDWNPDQADANTDDIGDVCQSDPDGDDIEGTDDNCPWHFNPEQADRDGDGIGDACDPYPESACGASNCSFSSNVDGTTTVELTNTTFLTLDAPDGQIYEDSRTFEIPIGLLEGAIIDVDIDIDFTKRAGGTGSVPQCEGIGLALSAPGWEREAAVKLIDTSSFDTFFSDGWENQDASSVITFDQEAASAVNGGPACNTFFQTPPCCPPSTGTYRPTGEGALTDFNGLDPSGTWTLFVADGGKDIQGGDSLGTPMEFNQATLRITVDPDTDQDGLLNSQDPDDDNDGYPDAEEIAAGSDPLDMNSIPAPEPTSVLLQLTALLTLAGLRRRGH